MREASARELARAIAVTVVPLRAAMWLTVSPVRTVYVLVGVGRTGGRGHGDDGQRERRAGPRGDAAERWRSGCDMVPTSWCGSERMVPL